MSVKKRHKICKVSYWLSWPEGRGIQGKGRNNRPPGRVGLSVKAEDLETPAEELLRRPSLKSCAGPCRVLSCLPASARFGCVAGPELLGGPVFLILTCILSWPSWEVASQHLCSLHQRTQWKLKGLEHGPCSIEG